MGGCGRRWRFRSGARRAGVWRRRGARAGARGRCRYWRCGYCRSRCRRSRSGCGRRARALGTAWRCDLAHARRQWRGVLGAADRRLPGRGRGPRSGGGLWSRGTTSRRRRMCGRRRRRGFRFSRGGRRRWWCLGSGSRWRRSRVGRRLGVGRHGRRRGRLGSSRGRRRRVRRGTGRGAGRVSSRRRCPRRMRGWRRLRRLTGAGLPLALGGLLLRNDHWRGLRVHVGRDDRHERHRRGGEQGKTKCFHGEFCPGNEV